MAITAQILSSIHYIRVIIVYRYGLHGCFFIIFDGCTTNANTQLNVKKSVNKNNIIATHGCKYTVV